MTRDTTQPGADNALDLDKLEALARAATPGPWGLQLIESGGIKHLCPADTDGVSILTVVEQDETPFGAVYNDSDADFIAAANPQSVLALIALARRAAQPVEADLGALGEQAEAWFAVVDVLHEVAPDWQSNESTGMKSAVAAIRKLATHPSEPAVPAVGDALVASLSEKIESAIWHITGHRDITNGQLSLRAALLDKLAAPTGSAAAPSSLSSVCGTSHSNESAAAPAEQKDIEWGHDLQTRLMAASQDITESEEARQVMAEAACLLASLTGRPIPTKGNGDTDKGEGA